MTKTTAKLFIMTTALMMFFAGCNNFLANDINDEKTDSQSKTVTLKGSLSVEGDAVPSEFLAMTTGGPARSALSGGSMYDGYSFKLKATVKDTRDSLDAEVNGNQFSIPLDAEKNYGFDLRIDSTNDGESSLTISKIMFGETESDPYNVNLKGLSSEELKSAKVCFSPDTSIPGNGKIALEIKTDVAEVKYVGYRIVFDANTHSYEGNGVVAFKDGKADIELTEFKTKDDTDFQIKNGVYDFEFKFYKDDPDASAATVPTPLAVAYQKVNVFAGFVTDTWISDGSAYFDAEAGTPGAFTVTQAAIEAYKNPKIFYVNGGDTNGSSWGYADDYNAGTSIRRPFQTLQQAIDTVIEKNDATSEYTIYVKDTVYPKAFSTDKDGTVLTAPIYKMADFNDLGTTALKLTIVGVGNDAKLNGQNRSQQNCGSVINAATGFTSNEQESALNLTLKNLTITGGEQGGVYVYKGRGKKAATVTIEKCNINYNTGSGGIYNDGGTVTVIDSTIEGNTTSSGGGGIYNLGGTVTLNGVSLTGNKYAITGGAESCDSIYISGGTVNISGTVTVDGAVTVANDSSATSIIATKEGAEIKFALTDQDAKMIVVEAGGTLNLNGNPDSGASAYKLTVDANNSAANGNETPIISLSEAESHPAGGKIPGGILNAYNCELKNNKNQDGAGAVIVATGANASFNSCEIYDCSSDKSANCIYANSETLLKLVDTQIAGAKDSNVAYDVYIYGGSCNSFIEFGGKVCKYGTTGGALEINLDAPSFTDYSNGAESPYKPIIINNALTDDSNINMKIYAKTENPVAQGDAVAIKSSCGYFDFVYNDDEYFALDENGCLKSVIFTRDVFRSLVPNYASITEYTIPDGYKAIMGDDSELGVFVDNTKNGATELVSVTIPDSVTKIGKYAFSNCENLTTVTIPSSVTTIGYNAFQECTSLESIALPETLTTIHDGAFNISRLKSIVIPEGVTDIPYMTFQGCTALESVTLPEKLKTIGNYAFDGCTALETVIMLNENPPTLGQSVFPSNVKAIIVPSEAAKTAYTKPTDWDDYKDKICVPFTKAILESDLESKGETIESVEYYTMPSGYGMIMPNTFEGCTNLKGVVISRDVVRIEADAFKNCAELASVTLTRYEPNRDSIITTIVSTKDEPSKPDSFNGCTELEAIYVQDNPSGAAGLGTLNSYYSSGWQSTNYQGILKSSTLTYSKASSLNFFSLSEIEIPYGYTAIENSCFSNKTNLTKVSLPESLETIGESAFIRCSNIESIEIPYGVKSIGNQAFYYCEGLTGITIPGSVETIGEDAFYHCTGLKEIIIKDGVKSIGKRAFYSNSGTAIERIEISKSVTSIGEESFYYWNYNREPSEAAKFTLTFTQSENPAEEMIIGSQAFYYCTGLEKLVLPNNIKSLGTSMVYDSSSPKQFFYSCKNLKSVEFEDGSILETIGIEAFSDCTALSKVTFPNSLKKIGYSAFQNSIVENITLPASVDEIGQFAFSNCTQLKSIALPSSITAIGNYAFNVCENLTSVTIPKNVTSIGNNAFYRCTNLKTVYMEPQTPPTLGTNVFFYDYNGSNTVTIDDVTLYVPNGCSQAYQDACNSGSWDANYSSKIQEMTQP